MMKPGLQQVVVLLWLEAEAGVPPKGEEKVRVFLFYVFLARMTRQRFAGLVNNEL